MKVDFLFAWYDLWVGLFWDKKNKWLYFLPFPMIGLIIKFDLFHNWMDELKQIAYEFSPSQYPLESKWMEGYWKKTYYDKKLTPKQAWVDYTTMVD